MSKYSQTVAKKSGKPNNFYVDYYHRIFYSSQPEEFIANVDVIAIDKEQVAELVLEEMECPICLIEMTPPKKIYACSNAHLFCQNCKVPALKTCPKCREDFVKQPPLRSTLAERWACKLFQL